MVMKQQGDVIGTMRAFAQSVSVWEVLSAEKLFSVIAIVAYGTYAVSYLTVPCRVMLHRVLRVSRQPSLRARRC